MQNKLPFPIFLLALFSVVAVAFLQSSLILYRLGGGSLHWSAILLLVPFCNGLLATLLSRRPYLASLWSSLLAASLLFLLYQHLFWKQPPTPLQGAAFFATLSLFSGLGVSATRLFWKRGRRRSRDLARTLLLGAYHLLAITAAVVTLLGTLR